MWRLQYTCAGSLFPSCSLWQLLRRMRTPMWGIALFSQAQAPTRPLLRAQYRILIFSIALVCIPNYSNADVLQQPEPPSIAGSPRSSAQYQPATRSSLIEIKLETTRSQATAGTGLGITAAVKNISDTTVYLNEQYIVLKFPPEVEGPYSNGIAYFGYFPTASTDPYEWYRNSVALKPGGIYQVFWTRQSFERTVKSGDPQGAKEALTKALSAATSISEPASKAIFPQGFRFRGRENQ